MWIVEVMHIGVGVGICGMKAVLGRVVGFLGDAVLGVEGSFVLLRQLEL